MKSLSSVVAIIMVLVITIALVGILYTWITTTVGSTAKTGTQVTSKLKEDLTTCMRIDSVSGNRIYLRNCGSGKIYNQSLTVFLDGEQIPHSLPSDIDPGKTGAVKVYGLWKYSLGSHTLKVTLGQLSVQRSVELAPNPSAVAVYTMDAFSGDDLVAERGPDGKIKMHTVYHEGTAFDPTTNSFDFRYIKRNINYLVQPGDKLVYEIYIDPNSDSFYGGVDFRFDDGTTRFYVNQPFDQNGIGAYPQVTNNLENYARGKWYKRYIPLDNYAGKTVLDAMSGLPQDSGTERVWLRNIYIMDSTGKIVKRIFVGTTDTVNGGVFGTNDTENVRFGVDVSTHIVNSEGRSGRSIGFFGVDDRVDFDDFTEVYNRLKATNSVTLAVYAKVKNLTTGYDFLFLAGSGFNTLASVTAEKRSDDTSFSIFRIRTDAGDYYTSFSGYPFDRWVLFLLNYNGTALNAWILSDGFSAFRSVPASGNLVNTWNGFKIGDSNSQYDRIGAWVDDVMIFDRALDPDEVIVFSGG